MDGNDHLFNIADDERERKRANRAALERQRLERLRAAGLAWNETMPPIPEDAPVRLGYSVNDMPQR